MMGRYASAGLAKKPPAPMSAPAWAVDSASSSPAARSRRDSPRMARGLLASTASSAVSTRAEVR
jgi:hypothetical protein